MKRDRSFNNLSEFKIDSSRISTHWSSFYLAPGSHTQKNSKLLGRAHSLGKWGKLSYSCLRTIANCTLQDIGLDCSQQVEEKRPCKQND